MVSTQFLRTADGRVLVWGDNEYGKGDPKSDYPFIVEPRQLDLPEPVAEVHTSVNFTCARGASGKVWCWGSWSHIPGAAPDESSHDFVAVPGVSGAKALMVSHEGHCVFDAFRRGLCWSANVSSELSTGSGQAVLVPLQFAVEMSAVEGNLVTLLPSVAAIEGGPVRTWGYRGALGWDTSAQSGSALSPQAVPGLADPLRVEGGDRSYCATMRDGRVYCWGQDILPFERAFEPFLAFEHGPYEKISVSENLCALDVGGHVECFDPRDDDAEGDGIMDISAGFSTLCLLTRDQRVLCKGDNGEAQQGNGSVGGKVDKLTEVPIPALH